MLCLACLAPAAAQSPPLDGFSVQLSFGTLQILDPAGAPQSLDVGVDITDTSNIARPIHRADGENIIVKFSAACDPGLLVEVPEQIEVPIDLGETGQNSEYHGDTEFTVGAGPGAVGLRLLKCQVTFGVAETPTTKASASSSSP